jgi:hypothetical protein
MNFDSIHNTCNRCEAHRHGGGLLENRLRSEINKVKGWKSTIDYNTNFDYGRDDNRSIGLSLAPDQQELANAKASLLAYTLPIIENRYLSNTKPYTQEARELWDELVEISGKGIRGAGNADDYPYLQMAMEAYNESPNRNKVFDGIHALHDFAHNIIKQRDRLYNVGELTQRERHKAMHEAQDFIDDMTPTDDAEQNWRNASMLRPLTTAYLGNKETSEIDGSI